MRKVLIVFCLSWIIYCVSITGNAIVQLKWQDRLQLSPSGVQERAGDIFNKAAVKASKLTSLARPEYGIVFVEDSQGLLKALPLTYWLYPTHLMPASSKYFTPDGVVQDDVAESLAQATARPEGATIFFVGKASTLKANAETLKNYSQHFIEREGDNEFIVLERKQ